MANTRTAGQSVMVWTGRVLTGLVGALMILLGVMLVVAPPMVVDNTVQQGFDAAIIRPLGGVVLACAAFYLVPRTTVLGAILLTGYFGGAIAVHVRAGEAFLPAAVLGVIVWLGPWLRDGRLRAQLPWRTPAKVPTDAVAKPGTPTVLARVGWVLTALVGAFLVFDAAGKLARVPFVVEMTEQLGYDRSVIVPLGVVLLAATVLYLLPWTAVPGAVLVTGYLGGAVGTHVRAHPHEAFPIAFPVLLGAVAWLALVLRDGRLRALLPWRTPPAAAAVDAGTRAEA